MCSVEIRTERLTLCTCRPGDEARQHCCCNCELTDSLVCARLRRNRLPTIEPILEHALLQVSPTRTAEFELAFAHAKSIISSMPGFVSLRLSRGIESPAVYLLLVEWTALEDHTEGFRQSQRYQEWKALLHHFYTPFPVVEHFTSVLSVEY